MVSTCVVRTCRSRIGGHRFPKNQVTRDRWLAAIRRGGWRPNKYAIVCKLHFKPDDYTIKEDYNLGERSFLKRTAVPSIFPPATTDRERGEWLCQRALAVSISRYNEQLKEKRRVTMNKDIPKRLSTTDLNISCNIGVDLAAESITDANDELREEDNVTTPSNEQNKVMPLAEETSSDDVKIKIEVETDTNEVESDTNVPFDSIIKSLTSYKNLCVINVAKRLSIFNKEFYDTFVTGEALVKLIINENLNAKVVTILQRIIFEFNCVDEEMLTFVLKALNGTEGYVYCNGIETKYEKIAKKKSSTIDILHIPYYKIQDKNCSQWFKAANNVDSTVIKRGIHTCCNCLERQRKLNAQEERERLAPLKSSNATSLQKKVKLLQRKIKVLKERLKDQSAAASVCKELEGTGKE